MDFGSNWYKIYAKHIYYFKNLCIGNACLS